MKKSLFVLITILVLFGFYSILSLGIINRKPDKSIDLVTIGQTQQQSETFDQSVASAKLFSYFYGKALVSINAKEYDLAIKYLNDCLNHVGIGTEKSMVYRKLVEIYRTQGNLEKELYYLEQIPKFTMSTRIKKECALRASVIRQLLATKNKTA